MLLPLCRTLQSTHHQRLWSLVQHLPYLLHPVEQWLLPSSTGFVAEVSTNSLTSISVAAAVGAVEVEVKPIVMWASLYPMASVAVIWVAATPEPNPGTNVLLHREWKGGSGKGRIRRRGRGGGSSGSAMHEHPKRQKVSFTSCNCGPRPAIVPTPSLPPLPIGKVEMKGSNKQLQRQFCLHFCRSIIHRQTALGCVNSECQA